MTVAEIAEKAEVAVTTVFNYFPTKEALIFDIEDELEQEIIRAIRERKKDQPLLESLHKYFLNSRVFNPPSKKTFAEFMKLIASSPELTAYYRGLWEKYAMSLAKEIQSATDVSKMEADCMARLILEGASHACRTSSPKEALNLMFKYLRNGWNK